MNGELKNIALIDDHVIVRNGLKELIEKLGNYKVYREYDDGKQLVSAFPITPTPDLLVMDLNMPEMTGEEVVSYMVTNNIDLPVLILTLNHDENAIIRLFRAGIRGYLEKHCTAAEMRDALNEIFTSGYYHNELLTFALRSSISNIKDERELILEKLTEREMEFMRLVCHTDEYTYTQIASIMEVSLRTVDGYRESVFNKLNVRSKTGLVLFIIKHKLVDVFGMQKQNS